MAMAARTRAGEIAGGRGAARGRRAASSRRRAYQAPTRLRMTMPVSAASANHAIEGRPSGTTMKAARSGPIACPVFPPTWKIDWAMP
jgi:hypothetical protein